MKNTKGAARFARRMMYRAKYAPTPCPDELLSLSIDNCIRFTAGPKSTILQRLVRILTFPFTWVFKGTAKI